MHPAVVVFLHFVIPSLERPKLIPFKPMLAYRHAFHAGNHADVLKHIVLISVLRYMTAKEGALTYVDTHAGAGGYALDGAYARKKAEHVRGIDALMAAPPTDDPLLLNYMKIVKAFNGGDTVRQYPGSPGIASMLLRPDDSMRLHEMHPTDERILRSYLGSRVNAKVTLDDGFAAPTHDLPPTPRRGVVLIDPSYELKSDYTKTLGTLREGLARFASGTFIVWYPQIQTVEATQLPKRLMATADAAPKGWLHATLTVTRAGTDGWGLAGSGVLVVNPPYTLADELRQTLPTLVSLLGQAPHAKSAVRVSEGGAAKPAASRR